MIMKFIRRWNELMFLPNFSAFDLLFASIIYHCATVYSLYWLLLLIPMVIFSTMMYLIVLHSEEKNNG